MPTTPSTSLRDINWKHRYTSSTDNLVAAFYAPALGASCSYDRASGFFRSTVFLLAGGAVSGFALRGGTARILCSPNLSSSDIGAIKAGVQAAEAAEEAVLRELTETLEDQDAQGPLKVLSALLGLGALEIRFALRNSGMFHDKLGIFSDQSGDRLSFSGSINETLSGWSRNHEAFEVFPSWTRDSDRVDEHVEFFENAWQGDADGVEVFSAPEALVNKILEVGPPDPEQFLKAHEAKASSREAVGADPAESKTPQQPALFEHQIEGMRSWLDADSRGVLKHATGSGKTMTGLRIAEQWLRDGGSVLILVPSRLLLDQWDSEIGLILADLDPPVLLAGGRYHRWRKNGLLEIFTGGSEDRCITVATMQTAASPLFLKGVSGGEHLLLIADEVHRMGSHQNRSLMSIEAGGRLGLSATPERYRDQEGTDEIFEYFGEILDPEFGIEDAIKAGRLTPYEYFVHVVSMSEEEAEDWEAITKEIGQIVARYEGKIPSPIPNVLKFALINRARIAKNAKSKAPKAASIVTGAYKSGQHWLVYCDNRHQVAEVREHLKQAGVGSYEYHSAMQGDREETIDRFERDGGVIVAIRCLDEGVDIPAISHAVILASSQNPREFIQRRGRVLRKAPNKHKAVIHDLLVKPPSPDSGDALATAELSRAIEFAQFALNLGASAELERLCGEWDVNPDDLRSEGIERDEMNTDEDQGSTDE
jgi:superfamily II DNA or RNA helicase